MTPVTDQQGPAWDAYLAVRRILGITPDEPWTVDQLDAAEQVARWLLDDVARKRGVGTR